MPTSDRFKSLPREKVSEILSRAVEITLGEIDGRPCFNVLRETLGRIGDLHDGVLTQEVHVLHKKGSYFLIHWKQMEQLDGLDTLLDDWDLVRLEKIVSMVSEYGLAFPVDRERIDSVKLDAERNVFVHVVRREDVDSGSISLERKYPL